MAVPGNEIDQRETISEKTYKYEMNGYPVFADFNEVQIDRSL